MPLGTPASTQHGANNMKTITIKDPVGYSSYGRKSGAFIYIGATNIANCGEECREVFSSYVRTMARKGNKSFIGFFHERLDPIQFAIFMSIAESRLRLSMRDRCKISSAILLEKAKCKGVTIHPSKWWLYSEMRRSVLTLLIRCGACFYDEKKGFDAALAAYELTNECKDALALFLSGHVFSSRHIRYNGGFVDCFSPDQDDWGATNDLDNSKAGLAKVMKKRNFTHAIRS